MKKLRRLRKGLAMLLSIAMVLGLMPGAGSMKVSAEESSATEETGTAAGITYTPLAGNPEGNYSEQWGDERYSMLLDGTADTKWCCSFTNPSYVIFKTSEPVYVNGYSIWTANDTGSESGRNPVAWTLSGCNDYDETNKTGGNWVTIHEVIGGKSEEDLPVANKTEKSYSFTKSGDSYQYFKLNITGIKSGSTMQLGDFSLTYDACEHNWATGEAVAPTCSEEGYTPQTCSVCHATQKTDIQTALGHSFGEDGLCTRCGASDTTSSKPAGDGTTTTPYRISTVGELLWFAGLVNGTLDGVTQNTSAYAVLATDINFGDNSFVAIGTETYPFSGTFDGSGHTITVNQSESNDVALFGFLGNSTVKNLTVTGTINTASTKFAAGIAMQTKSSTTATVENCISDVTIESNIDGVGTHAGLIGVPNGAVNINNCAFTGAINGASTNACGGMIGFAKGKVTIKNSYIAATFSLDETDCHTFGRNFDTWVTLDNCYYLNALGDVPASATQLTDEQFSSGEAAYLLQGDQTEAVWGQNIDNDQTKQNYPVLGGAEVYGNKTLCGSADNPGGVVSIAYSNSEKEPVYGAAHNVQKVEAKDATCTEAGNQEYWVCSYEEGVYYQDESIENKYDTVVIPATGHDFDENGICSRCSISNTARIKPEGDGTANNPYKIDTAGKLYWFAGLVNGDTTICTGGVTRNTSAHAVLTADITVNSGLEDKNGLLDSLEYDESGQVTNGNSFTSWTPIGSNLDEYLGVFDGQNHTVSGLYFNDTSKPFVGLFGYSEGTIKNVAVLDSYFSGYQYVGGVCGISFGSITNSYNIGAVSGTELVGGVCGKSRGSIANSHNTGAVSGTGDDVGGLCGNGGSITNSYNTGDVSGTGDYVGGLCGSGGSITNSYNTGDVSGNDNVGGVCGDGSGSSIANSHNTGAVSGTGKYVGGLCGSGGSITNSYNTGAVSGNDNVGGVCGTSFGRITNSYNIGAVSGTEFVGGVCGVCGKSRGSIENSYNTGAVSCSDRAGGLCGYNYGTITSCYNIGSSIYGVCFDKYDDGTITNCYYANADSATNSKGTGVSYNDLCSEVLPESFDASVWETGAVISTTTTYTIYRMPSLKGVGSAQTVSVGYYDYGLGDGEQTFIPISTPEDLIALANDSSKWGANYRYVLVNDIDMTGKDISPIGVDAQKGFKGRFSGNGHVVKNLTIEREGEDYIGLFGYNEGLIMDVGIEGGSIKGHSLIGAICGDNHGTISGCYNTATVIGEYQKIGGICGRIWDGTVKNCYNAGEVNGGGIYGECLGTVTVSNCFSASATGDSYCYNENATKISISDLCSSESLPTGLDDNFWVKGKLVSEGDINTFQLPAFSWEETPHTLSCGLYDYGTGEGRLACSGISTAEELVALANDSSKWGKNYVLTADIDMSGKEISPIGNITKNFTGKFSGNGHVVKNLTIDRTGMEYTGLFGWNKGLIMDLGIEGGSIKGYSYVGALCGQNLGTISGCYNTASVYGEGYHHGGLCGYMQDGSNMKNCYNTGSVSGNDNVGGVCGYVQSGSTLESCYNTATVSGTTNFVGGVFGLSGGTVKNCYYNTDYCQKEGSSGSNETNAQRGITTDKLCNGSLPEGFDDSVWNAGSAVGQKLEGRFDNTEYKLPAIKKAGTQQSIKVSLYDFGINGASDWCPYTAVSTADELVALGDNSNRWNENYVLTADIDMSGKSFSPIGKIYSENQSTVNKSFKGKFSGDGHVVKDLTIDVTKTQVGFFGYNAGLIMNLGIWNGNITGTSSVGGLCGENSGTVRNCYYTGKVNGSGDSVGGLCGYSDKTITNCYSKSSVNGSDRVGGVCGNNYGAISSCYSYGTVTGSGTNLGGVCGKNNTEFSGTVITNCYYNKDICQTGGIAGSDISGSAEGRKTREFNSVATFNNWDFGSSWELEPIFERPVLKAVKETYFAGSGTKEEPYLVSDLDTLRVMRNYVNAGNGENVYFTQTADIDMSPVYNSTDNYSWTPIGTKDKPFKGVYSGGNHTIKGIYIDTNTDCQGLFGYSEGTIMNLGLVDGSIKGDEYVGAVCGDNNGIIQNCYNTCTVSGTNYVGGVCGTNQKTLVNCYDIGTGTCTNSSAGGVCGANTGKVSNCYSLGDTEKEQTNGTWDKTISQFNKGEVAYLLSKGAALDDTIYDGSVWGQKLSEEDKQDCPVLGGLTVYQNETYKGCADAPGDVTYIYANTAAEPVYAAHAMTKVDKKDPTCTEDGNNEYWTCSYETDVYYKDEGRTEKYNSYEDEINIPATGHKDEDKDGKCDTCATYLDGIGAKLAGHSLTLDGSVGVNFYMELSSEVISDGSAYMEFTLPGGKTSTVKVNEAPTEEISGKTYYKFRCQVNAAEMTDTITAQLKSTVGNSKVYEYTVKEYADYLFEHKEGNEEFTKAAALIEAMVNYGSYAQIYAGYNADNLAVGESSKLKPVTDITLDASKYTYTPNENETKVQFAGANLSLLSTTTLRMYFKITDVDVANVSFTYGENTLEKTQSGDYYYVELVGIPASKLDDDCVVTVNDGTNSFDVTYTPMAYCANVINRETTETRTENLKNLMKALVVYNQAADAYIANTDNGNQ